MSVLRGRSDGIYCTIQHQHTHTLQLTDRGGLRKRGTTNDIICETLVIFEKRKTEREREVDTHTQTHTQTHTHTHTHTHTRTHTYTHMPLPLLHTRKLLLPYTDTHTHTHLLFRANPRARVIWRFACIVT